MQQVLTSEAVERAFDKLEWPDFTGRSVYVEIGSMAADETVRYLRAAARARIAEHGGILASKADTADFIAIVLESGVGTEYNETFFGLPPIQSVLLPISLPEIAVYKRSREQGVAKAEVVFSDRQRGGAFYRTGPALGQTHYNEWSVLIVGGSSTDTALDQVE